MNFLYPISTPMHMAYIVPPNLMPASLVTNNLTPPPPSSSLIAANLTPNLTPAVPSFIPSSVPQVTKLKNVDSINKINSAQC
eukprot:UN08120